MILGIVVMFSVGVLCIALGMIIWKKQKVTLIHDYHYKNVKKEDVGAYTKQMGFGLILIGIGIGVTEVINLVTKSGWGWIAFGVGFITGIIFMHKAQKKYNGSWLS